MININQLKSYTLADEKSLGLHGYATDKIYKIDKLEEDNNVLISMRLTTLDKFITVTWPYIENDINWYNNIIKQNLSYGAYIEGKLVGVIIAEKREWNNSISVVNFIISDQNRYKGIGSMLITKSI